MTNSSAVTAPDSQKVTVKQVLTDNQGHQLVLMAKLKIDYLKNRFSVTLRPMPHEVTLSFQVINALESLIDRANDLGMKLLDEFKKQTAKGGTMTNLFDVLPSAESDSADEPEINFPEQSQPAEA